MKKGIKIIFGLVIIAVFLSLLVLLANKGDKEVLNTEQNIMDNLNENTGQDEIVETEGLSFTIITEGQGQEAKAGDKVSVHYVGTLEDGTKFDSSVDRGAPFSFNLGAGQVIRGWDEGVVGMKIGEKRRLVISSDYAYGANGVPGVIPGGATLIFEVELLGLE